MPNKTSKYQPLKRFLDFLRPQPVAAFLCNFLLVMVIFTLSRMFFFLVNKSYFSGVDTTRLLTMLKGGLQFDLTALLYINLIYLAMQLLPFPFRHNGVYQRAARWVFVVTNGIAIIINCMDIPFFRFTNRRTTSSIFSEFSNEASGSIFKIILRATVEYWYVTLFAIAAIVVLWLLYRKPKNIVPQRSGLVYYLLHTIVFAVFAYYTVIGIRGGFGRYTRPITLSNANEYVNAGAETAIVLNTPFCLLRTIDKKVFKDPQYFDNEAAMTALYSPVHHPKPQDAFKPLNVVVIIWESFGKEYTGFFNHNLENGNYSGYTPFMDSLFTQGLTFEYSYANGHKSIEAMPSILSSIPMFVEPFISTPYSTNDISSLADALKQKGYYSAFFHGAPNGSMGFQAYAKAAGFDDYFGYNEYVKEHSAKDYDGTWAIWDEAFLQFYADQMGKMKQPFMTSVFTASSHHPFVIPKKYEGKFPQGKHPIMQCMAYTDYAIRRLFQTMSKYDWYKNTLFVITADHTNYTSHKEYLTDIGEYSVPVLFYQPGSNLKGWVDSIPVQQIDIMPSVLSYLNYDKPYFAYGQDFFTINAADKFVINYNNGIYQFLKGDYFQQFDGEKTKAVYNYKTDSLLKNNLIGQTAGQNENEMLIKSVIQQYIERMTENKLRIPK